MTIGKHVFAGTGNSAVLETDASNMVQLVNREGPLGVWFRVPGDPSTATKEHVWPNLHGDLGATSDAICGTSVTDAAKTGAAAVGGARRDASRERAQTGAQPKDVTTYGSNGRVEPSASEGCRKGDWSAANFRVHLRCD